MASLSKTMLIAHLGRDPELRTFPDGGQVANVRVATSEAWKDRKSGEWREHTEWHNVVFKRGLADVVGKYLVKGSQVYIEGRLRTRKYDDSQGVERYVTEIHADQMQMLGGKRKEGAGAPRDGQSYRDEGSDDTPF